MHNINVNYLQRERERAVNIKRAARRARGLCLPETLICVVLGAAAQGEREKRGRETKATLAAAPLAIRVAFVSLYKNQ